MIRHPRRFRRFRRLGTTEQQAYTLYLCRVPVSEEDVRQVAGLFAMHAGTVTKAAGSGKFLTNGKTGTDRRIDVLSVIRQQLAEIEAERGPNDT